MESPSEAAPEETKPSEEPKAPAASSPAAPIPEEDAGSAPVSTTPMVPVTVPVSGAESTIRVNAAVKEDVVTIDRVELTHLDKVIGDRKEPVTIDVSKIPTESVITTVVLPTNVIRKIAEMADTEAQSAEEKPVNALEIIFTEGVSIAFDAQALKDILLQAKGNAITISMEPYQSVTTLTDAQLAAVGGRDGYVICIISGKEILSELEGSVTFKAPYTLKSGETAENLVVSAVDEDGTLEPCETGYDAETEQVCWIATRLALFVIGCETP